MDTIPTSVTAERFDRAARLGNASEARDRRDDLRIGLIELVSALGHLNDAKVSPDYLSDLARCAHDAIRKCDAGICRDIDGAGIHAEPFDLSELDAIIARLG